MRGGIAETCDLSHILWLCCIPTQTGVVSFSLTVFGGCKIDGCQASVYLKTNEVQNAETFRDLCPACHATSPPSLFAVQCCLTARFAIALPRQSVIAHDSPYSRAALDYEAQCDKWDGHSHRMIKMLYLPTNSRTRTVHAWASLTWRPRTMKERQLAAYPIKSISTCLNRSRISSDVHELRIRQPRHAVMRLGTGSLYVTSPQMVTAT